MSFAAPARPVLVHPMVLRMEAMFPAALHGYQMHAERKGGDLAHVDARRSGLNRVLEGEPDWVEEALTRIEMMRHANLQEELEALGRRKRKADRVRRLAEGLTDPWKASEGGPLRELILTANSAWFDALAEGDPAGDAAAKTRRETAFTDHALEWLMDRFGESVIHARVDRDEAALHLHAILMPVVEKTSDRRGLQQLIQPSSHPLIQDYERAQDDVGEWFSHLGLRRGDRRAEARREARAKGVALPEKRRHIPPAELRGEAVRLTEKERQLDARAARIAAEAMALREVETATRAADRRAATHEQRAEVERRKALAAQAEAGTKVALADERQAEAEAVLAVAEGFAAGEIIMAEDQKGELVPDFAPRADGSFHARMKAALSHGRAKRLLERLTFGARRQRREAEQRAQAGVREERSRLAATEAEAQQRIREAEAGRALADQEIRVARGFGAAARSLVAAVGRILPPAEAAQVRASQREFDRLDSEFSGRERRLPGARDSDDER